MSTGVGLWKLLMSTIRQAKLAKAIVENLDRPEPKNKKELLVSSGYTESSAESVPGRIIEQQGVQEELIRLGFTEDNAKQVVAQILNDSSVEPNSRLKAADMTFKVHGSYAPEKSVQMQVRADLTPNPKRKELVEEFERKLLEQYQE